MTAKETPEITSGLEELKQDFEVIKKKHNLPEFSELNKQFDIEELQVETDFLLRKVRRTISEKINGYLRFVELILNPGSAPLFFFNLVKKLDSNQKDRLSKIYETLGDLETQSICLDIDYSEEKEAEFINKTYKMFVEELKNDLLEITLKMANGKNNNNNTKKNNTSYFG